MSRNADVRLHRADSAHRLVPVHRNRRRSRQLRAWINSGGLRAVPGMYDRRMKARDFEGVADERSDCSSSAEVRSSTVHGLSKSLPSMESLRWFRAAAVQMQKLLGLLAAATLAICCSTPTFEFLSPEMQTIAACRDGRLSPGESDVDCGQVCATPCASGKACIVDLDCSSAFCSTGVCQDQTCTDGLKNQDESDIDCGGSCSPCTTGKACRSVKDCDLTLCTGGKCRSQTCSDGITNQDETDVDCGGKSGCPSCSVAQHCAVDGDCDHVLCSKGSCSAPSCADGIKNATETDIDCGGNCAACSDHAACLVATDCTSHVCPITAHRCATPTCSDGVLNGDEPTVDCGTSCPNKCVIADHCNVATDCTSGTCLNQHCVPSAPTNTPIPMTGWVASASPTDSMHTPDFALDGDPMTYWSNGTPQLPGMWFMVDMMKPQVFFSIKVISVSTSQDYAKQMTLTASNDGQTFTELRTGILGENVLTISFVDPQYWRYIKLGLTDSTNGLFWRIDDLQLLQ